MSTPPTTTGFILAGGQSRRMGRDKALLEWHGRTLLEHMRHLLSAACESVVVVGRSELPDCIAELGPIGGVLTALRHTASTFNIITAVDLPFLTKEFLIHFKERCMRSTSPLTVCKIETGFPLCLGARKEIAPALESYVRASDRSVFGFIQQTQHEVVSDVDARLFENINSPADYQRALTRYNP